ncbi:aldehyde dehydrogenase family protein [Rubritalea marina]|uniref:aldehyde dehydrogenase family protein n=1 Tax=Rubritalea marina TaxID=361055 RepID=UPI0003AA3C9C|nr:aldehyde dehydrogenase family protein [Rubritalea marina]
MTRDQSARELVEAQRAYYRSGATRSYAARMAALKSLERSLMAHREEVLAALDTDLGKPPVEAYLAEYFFILSELRLVMKSLKKWMKPKRVSNPVYFFPTRTEERRDPFGVVGIFVPWNYPLQLALSPLVTAIAAGNCAVLKAAESAPATSALLAKIVAEALRAEHVTVMLGEVDAAQDLLASDLDFIFYTGSTQIGKSVGQSAASRLIPHVLELGGKCPVLVDKAVDVEGAARRVLVGKFFNGGQTCFAPDFVVVHESVKQRFVDACARLLDEIPWAAEMACVVNQRHFERLQGLLEEPMIQAEGAARVGGMKPTILPESSWDSKVMQEEIFGPILPVLTYREDADLVAQLRTQGSPLALYLFSENDAWVEARIADLPSGGVCVNDTMKQGSHLGVAFGGVGESGYGRYRSRAGFEAFTYQRAVVKRGFKVRDMFELKPPYGDMIEKLKSLMK